MDKPIFSGDSIVLEVIPPLILIPFTFTLTSIADSLFVMNGVPPVTENDIKSFNQLISYINPPYVGGQGILSLEIDSYFTAMTGPNKLPNKLKFKLSVTSPGINPSSGNPDTNKSYSGDCQIVYKNFPDYLTIN